jgi:outer membrane immunogenic protein
MRTKILVLVSCAATCFTSPALAGGFTGPRAELRGGLDRTTIDLDYDDGVDTISGSDSETGVDFGAEVGFDAALSPSVIGGAYAGIEFATTKECTEVFGNDRACLKLGRNLTLGARLGAVVSPKILLYVKGGYSNGQLKASYTDLADSSANFSDHTNRDGFHFGLGGEVAVAPKGYIRAEYVRTNYNGFDYSDASVDAGIDGHRDQLLLGFGLRF